MRIGQSDTQERLAHDAVYAHATEATETIIGEARHGGNLEKEFRSSYSRYRSPTHRLRFLDALRKELTAYIEQHRQTCHYANDPQCVHERAYATAMEMVRDELEMVNPAIAARHEALSFSQGEADQINSLLNNLAGQLEAMNEQLGVLTMSSQFTYDDIIDLLNGLFVRKST